MNKRSRESGGGPNHDPRNDVELRYHPRAPMDPRARVTQPRGGGPTPNQRSTLAWEFLKIPRYPLFKD
jgi:hypothetical protein